MSSLQYGALLGVVTKGRIDRVMIRAAHSKLLLAAGVMDPRPSGGPRALLVDEYGLRNLDLWWEAYLLSPFASILSQSRRKIH